MVKPEHVGVTIEDTAAADSEAAPEGKPEILTRMTHEVDTDDMFADGP